MTIWRNVHGAFMVHSWIPMVLSRDLFMVRIHQFPWCFHRAVMVHLWTPMGL